MADQTLLVSTQRLLELKRSELVALRESFGGCLLIIDEEALWAGRKLIQRALSALRPGSFLLVSAINGRGIAMHNNFNANFSYFSAQFLDITCPITSINFIQASGTRLLVLSTLIRLNRLILRHPTMAVLLSPAILVFSFLSFLANKKSVERDASQLGEYDCSSVCMVLRPTHSQSVPIADDDHAGYWSRRSRRRREVPARKDMAAAAL